MIPGTGTGSSQSCGTVYDGNVSSALVLLCSVTSSSLDGPAVPGCNYSKEIPWQTDIDNSHVGSYLPDG